jgi:hypothetical protein
MNDLEAGAFKVEILKAIGQKQYGPSDLAPLTCALNHLARASNMALSKKQDIFLNDGEGKDGIKKQILETLKGSRAGIARNITTLNKFMGSAALYRDFPDDFPKNLDILPDVPVYVKIKASEKPSPWALNFKYGPNQSDADLVVYVSQKDALPDAENKQNSYQRPHKIVVFSGLSVITMDTFFDKQTFIYLTFESKSGIKCTVTAHFRKSYAEEKAM